MKEKTLLLAFLIMLPPFSWAVTNVAGQAATRVYADPTENTASPGELFIIHIKVSNVKGLWAYEFKLKWEPDLLNVTSVTEGPFLNLEGAHKTFFVRKMWNDPDPMGFSGYIYVTCTLMGEPPTAVASGDGTLATVEFLVKKEGSTPLDLYDTKLLDYELHSITHTSEDGSFQYPPPHLTEISVEPSSTIDPSLQSGSALNINIKIARAEKLYTWSLKMSWDPSFLDVTKIEEGPFLNREGAYETIFTTEIHQEEGYVYANCTLVGEPVVSASGSGTLIIVTFLVEAGGVTDLHLYDTVLLNEERVDILHSAKDGYFNNMFRDVAIKSVEVSPREVRAGDSVSITVISKNEGTTTENFDVTVYYDDKTLGTLGVSNLEPGAEKALTFSWGTKGVAEGKYTVKAVVSQVPWETDVDDNTYVYEFVTITPPEQLFPFTLVIAVMVVIIVVAIVSIMLRRKKR